MTKTTSVIDERSELRNLCRSTNDAKYMMIKSLIQMTAAALLMLDSQTNADKSKETKTA